jgi:hypothetical protein
MAFNQGIGAPEILVRGWNVLKYGDFLLAVIVLKRYTVRCI